MHFAGGLGEGNAHLSSQGLQLAQVLYASPPVREPRKSTQGLFLTSAGCSPAESCWDSAPPRKELTVSRSKEPFSAFM